MQRKAHLLFLPASWRVRGEFEREHPLIYGVKLTQLAGLGSAHGFIRVGYKFENQGARERILRPYYDPPFKCRVPNSFFLMLYPYLLKGFALARSEREIGEKLARNWHKIKYYIV